MHQWHFRFVGAFVLALPIQAYAGIIVSDWSLVTAVQNLDPNSNPPQDVSTFDTVENPFLNSHSAVLGQGTATTAYDFSWSGDNASFRINASHVVPDLGSAYYKGLSVGTMNFSVTADVLAHLTGTYGYSLPVPGMDTIFGLSITDLQPPHQTLSDSRSAATFIIPSDSGTFVLDASMVLQAGHNYLLQYTSYIAATGNSGALASGDGFLDVTFQPVPEPATLWLAATAAILVRLRRR